MTRLVEISPEEVSGVRGDLVSTRRALDDGLGPLRRRASWLGVPTGGFDEALGVADRLGTSVIPVVDTHLRRAEDLARLRYRGSMGQCLPVVDADPPPPSAATTFTQSPVPGGGTVLSWTAGDAVEQEQDAVATRESRGITGWLGNRWDDISGAVSDGADWVSDRASDAWDAVTDAGAAIGDWWQSATADLGSWIDQHGAGVREFIGRHVGVFRFLASACRVVGWVVVVVGAVLTVGLAIIGAMGGAAIGAVFGFGVGAVPGGAAGAAAGAAFGLKVLGAGFALVAVGDFIDVAADWGEGTIDGQQLVQRGALELGLAVTSLIGAGAIGKGLQKLVRHLPTSWRARFDELLGGLARRQGPLDHPGMVAPLRSGAPMGPGWRRIDDTRPDPQYHQPRGDHGPGLSGYDRVPDAVDPGVARIGGSLDDVWGTNPATGRPFTEAEWAERYVTGNGTVRWPPNDGAVPGTRVVFDDPAAFQSIYGRELDRVGGINGDYLGIPPGTPFDHRSLPPGHLSRQLHDYSFTGDLPPGLTIEVSEIAPAFGRPGGGIQVRFLDGADPVPIRDLLPGGPFEGVLR